MNQTPKGSRLHIAIFGRRNVGKSSFLNAFIGQDKSIVSNVPGTTTDPVEKAYELNPFGPVMLTDTAGVDDTGMLGNERIKKTKEIVKGTDFALLLLECGVFGDFEHDLVSVFNEKKIPFIFVINKIDTVNKEEIDNFTKEIKTKHEGAIVLNCSALENEGVDTIKKVLISRLEVVIPPPPLIADLVNTPDLVVLVIPIDKEAPKGRLILPQVQTLRELLDADIPVMVVKERELRYTLEHVVKNKPKLVVTDSQAFLKVDADVPNDIDITSFSILFARQKGDLIPYIQGVKAIDSLKDGDKVLIAELCSHRPITEDIGRVKIPRWLKQYTGCDVQFDVSVGMDTPDLSQYKLVIQCGGCVTNRAYILSRIQEAQKAGVPITNYGITIAFLHGIINRALVPFPEALDAWQEIADS